MNLPTENAKDKVEHEEGPDDDERHEESPVEHIPNRVVGLRTKNRVIFMAMDAGSENCFYVM